MTGERKQGGERQYGDAHEGQKDEEVVSVENEAIRELKIKKYRDNKEGEHKDRETMRK